MVWRPSVRPLYRLLFSVAFRNPDSKVKVIGDITIN